ncbi:DUF3558 family protein [Nocardia sp. NPDC057227]|uniref:DUF3558 family protein n=1 Tax=Nocardia sp. NPDC057227 TaxID=3346056 RepID=UPI00363F8B70
MVAALALGPLLAGCESSTEGADPAQKNDNPFGVPRTGWSGCLWGADGYALRVSATTRSLEEFRNNSRFHDFRPAELPGRDATLFVQGSASEAKNCNAFYGTTQGTIQIFVIDDQLGKSFAEPCGLVTRAARAIDQWIPGEFEALAGRAAAGELRIASGVAEACAAECDRYVQELISLRRRTASIVNLDSFGVGGPGSGSLSAALGQHIETAQSMADMFRKAGAAYAATEAGNASDLSAQAQ